MPSDRLHIFELVRGERGLGGVEVVSVTCGAPLGPGGLSRIAEEEATGAILLHVLRDVELIHIGDVPLILVEHDHADLVVAVPVAARAE